MNASAKASGGCYSSAVSLYDGAVDPVEVSKC
jgi:hypothetical protein